MAAVRALLLSAALVAGTTSGALDVPAHTGWVVDTAGVLSSGQRTELEAELAAFHRQSGRQVEALIVPTLEGESIEGFSIRVAEKWAVGDRKRDDGVLLVVATQDRLVRIEVGQGLEGELTDAIASRLIRGVIIPHFQRGDFPEGVRAGLRAILSVLSGDATLSSARSGGRERLPSAAFTFIFIICVVMLILARGVGGGFPRGVRRRSGWGTIGGTGWGGSGGWGGGGLGGIGGFGGGGGGFSGGGSSGRW